MAGGKYRQWEGHAYGQEYNEEDWVLSGWWSSIFRDELQFGDSCEMAHGHRSMKIEVEAEATTSVPSALSIGI